MIQKQRAEQEQASKKREEYCDLIYSQYESTVFAPVESFMESFNGQYPGTHIYDLKLTEFNETVLFDFWADHA